MSAAWLFAGVTAAPAAAADFYVDIDVAVPNSGCMFSAPCKTITQAIADASINGTSTPDTIHVGRSLTDYPAVAVTDLAVTLLGNDYDFTGPGPALSTVDGGSSEGISLTGTQPKTIQGLRIRGGDSAGIDSSLGGNASNVTVQSDTFDDAGPGVDYLLALDGSPTIRDNTFTGTDDNTGAPVAIDLEPAGAPTVAGNQISGVKRAMYVFGSPTADGSTISGNTVEVKRSDFAPSAGIYLTNITGLIAGNTITGVDSTGGSLQYAVGIYAIATPVQAETLTLRRNRIFDLPGPGSSGVSLYNKAPTVLEDDVITGNATNVSTSANLSQLSVTNETLWGAAGTEMQADGPAITVDSSIVGAGGVVASSGGSCASSFSRSPTAGGCGFGIGTPTFVDAASNNYHLASTGNSLFFDQGNPADPGTGALDIDAEPRALDGIANGICLPRRDIGADEVAGLSGSDCVPAALGPTARRCPKGKRLVTVKKHGKKKKKCKKKKRRKRKK
jgi:hypothetical protein